MALHFLDITFHYGTIHSVGYHNVPINLIWGLVVLNGKTLTARIISEIRGEMTDQEFADALKAFTKGELDLSRTTIQKYRAGLNEPSLDNLQKMIAMGKEYGTLSVKSLQDISDFLQLPSMDVKEETSECRSFSGLVNIPVLGYIPAGYPIIAVENTIGTVTFPREFLKGDDYFSLRVTGESMKDVDINNGDVALVRKSSTAEDGQTVVASLNNNEVTVKKFYKAADKIMLVPANKEFRPIQSANVRILGIVDYVVKNWEA